MVLIKSFERAERVYQAMLLRGFQGRFYSLQEFHLRLHDLAASLAVIMGSSGVLLIDQLQLHPLVTLFYKYIPLVV
jgi:cobalt/nickel transport system permease protein